MPGDGHDLLLTAPEFRQSGGGGLSQTVDTAVRQAGLVAPFAEPIAEAVRGERTPERRHKERQLPTRGCIDDGLELRDDRDSQVHRLSASVLLLGEDQPAAFAKLMKLHRRHLTDISGRRTTIATDAKCITPHILPLIK